MLLRDVCMCRDSFTKEDNNKAIEHKYLVEHRKE